jgi:hypothetical protein
MKCSYCGKTIEGKPKKVGPRLRYCGNRCYVLDAYESHPGTSLANGLEKMYPEFIRKGYTQVELGLGEGKGMERNG